MDPTSWPAMVERIGFPAAVCLILLFVTTVLLRQGFGAVHARIDETNRRLGVLAYILGAMAGDGTRKKAEELMGAIPEIKARSVDVAPMKKPA